MHDYNKKILEVELETDTPCELKHREYSRAVDYITQDIGQHGQLMYSVNIPICQECIDSIIQPEWVLLYCLKCTSNQWINEITSKLHYCGKSICWMSCCPKCREDDEPVNVFFTD